MQTGKTKVVRPVGIQLEHRAEAPTYYADGVTEVAIGIPVSRLTFHTVEGLTEEGSERRVSCFRVVLPTPALIEGCRNILAQCLSNQDGLEQAFAIGLDQTKHFLAGIDVSVVPPFEDKISDSNE